ncbi:hypothetical protein ACFVT5_41070 [Streptomyces sp. NPDC058001]|uniref:hypothetical protein n=1 Tax=Streptomyces sp. NPDC058001 TaxID=3346300 RepID=UPI0036EFBD56
MSAADRAAHEAASHVRVAPEVLRAVTRYEVAAARYDELIEKPGDRLTPAEFDAFRTAQQVLAESLGILADSGELGLIGPAETASRYRQAAGHCRRLSTGPAAAFDELMCLQDEMAMCRCQLAAAGRLDLIGGAS